MNNRYHRFIGTFISLLGLAICHAALAGPPVKVNSAEPAEAPQDTTLVVTINGSGFDTTPGAIEAINFLLPCVTNCTDTGGVTVRPGWVVHSSKKISATIDITAEAVVEFRDIEVQMTRGRGGKGTTLFKVQSKDGSSGNDDSVGRAMICTLNEVADLKATVMDDGDPVYENNIDKVLCLSGDVVGDHLSPLRFSNLPGGNPKQIKFAKRFLDLAFGDCVGPGCNVLPTKLTEEGTPDTAYVHVAPYADQDHIHLLDPGLHALAMRIDPRDFDERYSIQMSSRNPGVRNNNLCYFDAEGYETTDDINVFVWEDGVYSGVMDGLPDGYTVTTGNITGLETTGNPPTVEPGSAQALVCSNTGPNGEQCAEPKDRDDLCFVLGKVAMRFTLHMEYK